MAWYSLITIIVIVGVGLIVYSRNEKHSSATVAAEGPTATDHWATALAIDLCGSLQKDLAASTNVTSVGLRTFGNGLIDISPGVVTNSANFEGKKANLGTFAKNYSGFTLTDSAIKIPGKTKLANGANCSGPLHGKGTLVAKVWSSPTASPITITKNITAIHLTNDQMITLAFVPSGASIPEPSATVKSTLISTVAANAKIGTIATTTTTTIATAPPASTSTTTSTVAPTSTTTTTKAPTTTTTPAG